MECDAAVHTCSEEGPHPAARKSNKRAHEPWCLKPANNCSSDCSNIRMSYYGKTRDSERVLGGKVRSLLPLQGVVQRHTKSMGKTAYVQNTIHRNSKYRFDSTSCALPQEKHDHLASLLFEVPQIIQALSLDSVRAILSTNSELRRLIHNLARKLALRTEDDLSLLHRRPWPNVKHFRTHATLRYTHIQWLCKAPGRTSSALTSVCRRSVSQVCSCLLKAAGIP